MLILERKSNESITIHTPSGDNIIIHMIDTTRGKAKFGIDAPEDYLIVRDELIEESSKADTRQSQIDNKELL